MQNINIKSGKPYIGKANELLEAYKLFKGYKSGDWGTKNQFETSGKSLCVSNEDDFAIIPIVFKNEQGQWNNKVVHLFNKENTETYNPYSNK